MIGSCCSVQHVPTLCYGRLMKDKNKKGLSTDQIKGMFRDFFSTKEFAEFKFIYWLEGCGVGNREEIKLVAPELGLDGDTATSTDVVDGLMRVLCDPKSWKRSMKCRVAKKDWIVENLTSVKAFEEVSDFSFVLNEDLFVKHCIDADCRDCVIRNFVFFPSGQEENDRYTESFGAQDMDITVLTDPNDEVVLGFFIHED
jgi:hypothetical protein